jgi:hypothetical protein
LKLGTKLAGLAVAASTAGLLGFSGVTTAAHACGQPSGAPGGQQVPPGAPVYAYTSGAGAPTPGPQTGFVGVTSPNGYIQANGTVGSASSSPPGASGSVTASGGAGGQSGVVSTSNDGSDGNTAGPVGVCHS